VAQSKDFTPSVFVERDWWRTSNSSPWSRTVRLPSLQGAWHWWCSPRRRLERDQGSLRTPTSRWSTPRSVRQRPRNKRHKIRKIRHSTTAMEFVLVLWHPLLSYGYSYRVTVPDRVKPSFVIFDIRALWRSGVSVRVPGCQKLQMTASSGLAHMLYSCTHMATVGVKGLTFSFSNHPLHLHNLNHAACPRFTLLNRHPTQCKGAVNDDVCLFVCCQSSLHVGSSLSCQ